MNISRLNGFNSVQDVNTSVVGSNSPKLDMTSKDSVSFSASKNKNQTEKTSFIDKLMSVFNVSKTEKNDAPKVNEVWLSGDGVTPDDANSELANSLRAITYVAEAPSGQEYNAKMYSEAAIKTIVKYSKEDGSLADKLTQMFEYSAFEKDTEHLEYLVQKQKTQPEQVQKYEQYSRGFDDYIYLLKSADIDEDMTDVLVQEKTKDGVRKYSPIEVAIIIDKLSEHGSDLITKYATEPRIAIVKDDVFALCEKDAECSEQIEEIIDFADKNDLSKQVRLAYISNILPFYLEDAQTTKGLMLSGIFDKQRLKEFSPAFVQAPEQMQVVLAKQSESKFGELQNYEVPEFVLKVQAYEQTIKDLTGSDYKDLSLSQLKKIVSLIENGKAELDSIISE